MLITANAPLYSKSSVERAQNIDREVFFRNGRRCAAWRHRCPLGKTVSTDAAAAAAKKRVFFIRIVIFLIFIYHYRYNFFIFFLTFARVCVRAFFLGIRTELDVRNAAALLGRVQNLSKPSSFSLGVTK